MNNLIALNNISYDLLNGAIEDKINCHPLMFHPISKNECFGFLCREWVNKNNREFGRETEDDIKFTDQQLALLTLLMNNKHLLIPKHRETGETLITSIYLTWEAYYNNKSIIIVSPSRHIGGEVLHRIKFMLEAIMSRNNLGRTGDNKLRFSTQNGTKLSLWPSQSITTVCRPSEFSGKVADIVYFSNAAFLINSLETYSNALMTLRNGKGQVIMSSTSNGEDNLFYPLLTNTVENTFVKFPMINPLIPPNDPESWPFM
jgi:hypothetical protein